MAINKDRSRPVNNKTEPNIVRELMDRPGVIPCNIEDLPSDIANVVRAFDAIPTRRAMRRRFDVAPEASSNSVILAYLDRLRDDGYTNAGAMAIHTFYTNVIKPLQPDWTIEEIRALQKNPERMAQEKQIAHKANLRRVDALIERLSLD